MTSSQSKLKRPETQTAPERGFAGRAPLLTGMLAKKDELRSSAILLKTVSQAVSFRQAREQYARKLLSHANEITEARRTTNIASMIEDAIRKGATEKEPESLREALEFALIRKGVSAQIIDEKKTSKFTFFKVLIGKDVRTIPIVHDTISGDSVAKIEEVLGTIGIVRDNDEMMHYARMEKQSSRPPTAAIEVDDELLRKRRVCYDGMIGSKAMQFTYYASGINTSFAITGELKNGELIAAIDRKLIEIHIRYGKPMETVIVEQQASEKARFRVPADSEAEMAVNAIDFLARSSLPRHILPNEYRDAVLKIRASEEFLAARIIGPVSEKEAGDFRDAFGQLDNPAHAMVRKLHPHFCGENGELTQDGREIVLQTLKLGEKEEVRIDSAALANIATAYSILTGNSVADIGDDELRRRHFEMMFTIRTKMKELTGNLIFRTVRV